MNTTLVVTRFTCVNAACEDGISGIGQEIPTEIHNNVHLQVPDPDVDSRPWTKDREDHRTKILDLPPLPAHESIPKLLCQYHLRSKYARNKMKSSSVA